LILVRRPLSPQRLHLWRPNLVPRHGPRARAEFQRVTKGALSGNAGQPAKEDFKINGQYVNTPVINGQEGVVGIPFFDEYVEKGITRLSRPQYGINAALLHEHQFHEGAPAQFMKVAPAEHAGSRVSA
jgi:hypothetical protein